jgi:hypothetical protein
LKELLAEFSPNEICIRILATFQYKSLQERKRKPTTNGQIDRPASKQTNRKNRKKNKQKNPAVHNDRMSKVGMYVDTKLIYFYLK